jgi:hypothetical protein
MWRVCGKNIGTETNKGSVRKYYVSYFHSIFSFLNEYFSLVFKGKVIPLQAWTGPEDSRRLRLLYFKTIGTFRR